jgi:phosphonate transport system ATP-binding protein
MTAPVLEAKRLFRTYGARKALDDVSLTVMPGEMVALIGPSGSGKSTLMRNATGLITADPGTGEVNVLGIGVQKNGALLPSVREARSRVGFVFQQFNLVGRLSLFQNVMVGALGRLPFWQGFFGRWPKADKERGMQALARVGVAEYAAQRANTLSGGQQQRGAIARALVQGAEAIFLDEPVASLDPVSARKVMELLQDLNEQDGVTVVVVLHQIDYAIKFCKRVVALKAGKIVYDGPPAQMQRDQLIEIYGAEYDEESGGAAPLEEKAAVAPAATGDSTGFKIARIAASFALLAMAAAGLYFGGQAGAARQNADVIFSILPTENSASGLARWDPLIADMRRQTGLSIVVRSVPNYNASVTAIQNGQTQVAWFSNKSGMEAVSTGAAEVFLRSSDPSGVDGYNSVLIVPKDSPVTLERVMACDRSLSFGMGDANSTSGTLAPMAFLFAPNNIDPENCFKGVRASSHEGNVQAVANRLLDVATNNSTSLQVLGAQDPGLIAKVKVIWTSPTLPEDPIIWRKDLDPQVKQRIRQFFLNYGRQGDAAQQQRERAILASLSFGMFQPATNDHLLPVRVIEATSNLIQAQQRGNQTEIDAAQKALDDLRAEETRARARAPALLPSTPTEGYAVEGAAQ